MTKWQWTFNGESSPRQFGTQKELMEALGVSNMTIRNGEVVGVVKNEG